MSGIIGRDILVRSRERPVVWGRAMVAYTMRKDGMTLYHIAHALDLNHSTIVYAVKNVKRMLRYPSMYSNEWRIWQEFNERLSL